MWIVPLKSQLTLKGSLEVPLTIQVVDLLMIKGENSIAECLLKLQIGLRLYKRVEDEALFNLKPEIRGPFSGGTFHPSLSIQIKATLEPTVLTELVRQVEDSEQAAAYLQQLSREELSHPLLHAHSWYALEVKQQQETGEVGYRTLWYYLNPADITSNGIDPEKMNQAMLNFAKDWENQPSSDAVDGSSITDKINELGQVFESLTQDLSATTEEIVSETVEEITQAFEELTDSFSEIVEALEESEIDSSIYDALIDFFKAESWPFQTLPQQATLRLAFKGKNGQWDCYAKAREEQQQVVFYSICPFTAPKATRHEIAEFITRANYGLILGNFELDLNDGDIRYKTSIDVEGDKLTGALIRNLVYTNVLTMDQYLPGIFSMLEQGMAPEQAIHLIEQNDSAPSDA